jgi:hypothetical protein
MCSPARRSLCISHSWGERLEAAITQANSNEAFAITISFRRRSTSQAWCHKGCIHICSVLTTSFQLCGIGVCQTRRLTAQRETTTPMSNA